MKATVSAVEIKKQNRSRIIKYVIENKITSRQAISKALGFSMPTVFSYVTELIEAGMLCETGEYDSTGGRKAKMIAIRRGYRYAAGIDITEQHVRMALLDLSGDILNTGYYNYTFEDSAVYYRDIGSQLERFLDENHVERSRMSGVGVSLPGTVIPDTGVLQRSHVLNVAGVSLQRFVQSIPYPTIFGNDAKCAAHAEVIPAKGNSAYFSLRNTLGGAIYRNGILDEGNQFKSGEFGHMILHPGGRQCYCGKQGCLNAYCSASVLRGGRYYKIGEFFDDLAAGDPECVALWDEYMEDLAMGVTNIRMAFDCNIILGGYVGYYMEAYMDEFAQRLRKYNSFDTDTTYLGTGRLKEWASAVGVAQMMVERYIDGTEL